MRLRTTLVLALLVAALGGWLWFIERPAAERESEKKPLLAVEPARVARIELAYPSGPISLARGDDGWRITAPIDAAADAGAVRGLVASISGAARSKTVTAGPAGLAAFGLEPPSVSITLGLDDGSALPALAVGKSTPIGALSYARVGDGDEIVLTAASLGAAVRKSLRELRDKTVLPFRQDAVREIRILANGHPETVLRREGSNWSLARPREARAEPSQVQGFLNALAALRASDFLDGAPTPAQGLVPPRQAISLVTDDGALELLVGSAGTGESDKDIRVARGSDGPVFLVGEHLLSPLDKAADDFRDKTVLAVDPARLARIDVSRDDGDSFAIESRDGAWHLLGADGPVHQASLDRLADDVRTLRGSAIASEPPDLRATGLDRPTLRIALADRDGAPLGAILVARRDPAAKAHGAGAATGATVYAAAEGGPTAFEIASHVFSRLDRRRADLLDTAAPTPTPAPTPPR